MGMLSSQGTRIPTVSPQRQASEQPQSLNFRDPLVQTSELDSESGKSGMRVFMNGTQKTAMPAEGREQMCTFLSHWFGVRAAVSGSP